MTNPIVGHVTCPHCGNKAATVHRESRGKKSLYYRCYDGPSGECGTVQIRGPGGQKFLIENYRPLGGEENRATIPQFSNSEKTEEKEKSGFLSSFFGNDEVEE